MTTTLLRAMHSSLQFSDTPAQKKSDVSKIAERVSTRKAAWWTGTESGEQPLKGIVHDAAVANGYTFHQFKGNFVCVRKAFILPNSYKIGAETVVDNDLVIGPGHDLNFAWAQFTMANVGQITVIASHLATRGRQGTDDPDFNRNTKWNRKLAEAIGTFAKKQGAGSHLVFYGGDQNDNDKFQDTFFGQPLTSAQDELGRYEKTHWATIDVIASYDRDGRVKAKYVQALDDNEFKLFTDHYPVEAGFEVRNLR